MNESIFSGSELNLNPRFIRHQIITETNRLAIARPIDDYTLLQKLKATQRQSALDVVTSANEYIASFAQVAFHTSAAWKATVESRSDLKEIISLLGRNADAPLTSSESNLIRETLSHTPRIALVPISQPKENTFEQTIGQSEQLSDQKNIATQPPTSISETVSNNENLVPRGETTPRSFESSRTPPLRIEHINPLDKVTMGAIRFVLGIVHEEYKRAATYFSHRGAQTRSINYGGSRSHTYMNMLKSARSLREFRAARKDFLSRHVKSESAHDEYGGVLRILGRRLAWIPLLGTWLENKVREDDRAMREAEFRYPENLTRHYAKDDGSISTDRQA